ncbi:MAG: hypothetical protein QOJ39_964 [Candidatus Eremiobacteraeota bacterium]|jgi:hypothetical protein|nr:hypothetical protein [Candidatus Eremiobacteraeota bacterium]
MTIVATHFSIVLGAWRLRIRLDIDEPRESELNGERATAAAYGPDACDAAQAVPPHVTSWGRG